MTLEAAQSVQRVIRGNDLLSPTTHQTKGDARDLSDPELAQLLAGQELGVWALDAEVIQLASALITRRKVQYVFEFGSGVSTVIWSVLMRRLWGSATTRVFAIEQDAQHVARTNELLQQAGCDALARVRHVPLGEVTIGEWQGLCYQLSVEDLSRLLEGVRPDLVVIDGPSGPPGVRRLTLPLVVESLAPDALILLDDAFRTAEIQMASQWHGAGLVDVLGINMAGKGAAIATRGTSAAGIRDLL